MFIPDPNFFHPGSEFFQGPGSASKYFNPKKWFLSSWKYDLGCSSGIRILIFYPYRIQDPEDSDPNTVFCRNFLFSTLVPVIGINRIVRAFQSPNPGFKLISELQQV
jgi:hypothetical protein